MNWGQLNVSSRPDHILANPAFDDAGATIGCFVVYGPLQEVQVADKRMRVVLESLAQAIHRIGPPPRGWWRSDAR